MTSFQLAINDDFVDFSHTKQCYGNEKKFPLFSSFQTNFGADMALCHVAATATRVVDIYSQIMKTTLLSASVTTFVMNATKPTDKKLSWKEALLISAQILEKAENERNFVADKEAKLASFWDSIE